MEDRNKVPFYYFIDEIKNQQVYCKNLISLISVCPLTPTVLILGNSKLCLPIIDDMTICIIYLKFIFQFSVIVEYSNNLKEEYNRLKKVTYSLYFLTFRLRGFIYTVWYAAIHFYLFKRLLNIFSFLTLGPAHKYSLGAWNAYSIKSVMSLKTDPDVAAVGRNQISRGDQWHHVRLGYNNLTLSSFDIPAENWSIKQYLIFYIIATKN